MVLPSRQLLSGLVIRNLRPILKSAGPADAAGAFRILITIPEVLFLFFFWNGPPAGGLARGHSLSIALQLNAPR